MANEDYKNGKLVEIVREFNNTGNQYEANGIKQAIAVPFWRRENDKFQVIPKGSYSFINEAGNDYLKILDSTILQQATQFQIVYDYLQLSSKYIEDFPDVVVLTEKYNQLVDDTTNLFSYLKSAGLVADTLQMTKVLSALEPLTTWYMDEKGEIRTLPVSDLYGKFQQMIDTLYAEIKKLLIKDKESMSTELKNETSKLLGSLNDLESNLSTNISELSTEEIKKIIAEGKKQIELVTNAGSGLAPRVETLEKDKLDKGELPSELENAGQIYNELDTKKMSTGDVPREFKTGRNLLDLIEKLTGCRFDKNLIYVNMGAGVETKEAGKIYLDTFIHGVFKCLEETRSSTVTDKRFYTNISLDAILNRVLGLEEYKTINLPNYKGEYNQSTTYQNGDVVLVKGLEEGYCFEVTNPEMSDSSFPKFLRKVFKVNSEMYFEMIDNNWEIIFDRETPIEMYTIPQKGTTQEYISTFDNYYPFSEMRRVMLKNGVEQYELDFNDSNKKKGGGSSVLTGTDGDVMVRIPKFYCDIKKVAKGNRYRVFTFKNPTGKLPLGLKPHPLFESVNKYYTGAYKGYVENGVLKSISGKSPTVNKTIASFRDSARQGRDNKFNITSINELSAIFILFLIEFADLNSQKLLGQGRSNTSSLSATGTTNALGSRSGRISTDDANGNISYRGIEDVFGNIWSFVDGLLMCDDGYYYTNNPANYGNKAQMTHFKASPVTGEGYISKMEWIKGIEHLFIPNEIKATDSTYYCDYIWCHQAGEENIVLAGGLWADGSRDGLACLSCDNVASSVYSAFGARLSYASQ